MNPVKIVSETQRSKRKKKYGETSTRLYFSCHPIQFIP